MKSPSIPALALALSFVVAAVPVPAQTSFVPQPPSDADLLAAQVRILAVSPQNVAALIAAGELSLRLDDLTAAAAFFARAEKVDPRNGRIKAGEASLLVRGERPGEALRYFAQAEAYGTPVASFAADRALAYDLIGEQERAQRDYRTALKQRVDDETVRRYALSLGISGKRDLALDQLAALIRRGDRGAWRARAFILAMGGDVAGSESIAKTMMPPGMAQGLQPFFERLPTLPAIDRAFAVHFGEVRATPERYADARLAPALAPLGPEPGIATALASVPPKAVEAAETKRKDRRARKVKPGRTQLAAAPVPVPARIDVPPAPPAYQPQPAVALAQASPLPSGPYRVTTAPRPNVAVRTGSAPVPTTGQLIGGATLATPGPTSPLAARTVVATPSVAPADGTIVRQAPSGNLAAAVVASSGTPASAATTTSRPVTPGPVGSAPAAAVATDHAGLVPAGEDAKPVPAAGVGSTVAAPVRSVAAQSVAVLPTAAVVPGFSAASTEVRPSTAPDGVASTSPLPAATPASPPGDSVARASEDSVLAKIVAGLSIPASELGVGQPAPAVPAAIPPAAVTASVPPAAPDPGAPADHKAVTERQARTAADRKLAAQQGEAGREARVDKESAASKKRATGRNADVTDKPLPGTKGAADKPSGRDKKLAADKRVADRKAADEKALAKADPGRIWVQVAGGANEGDLPRAWAAVKKKAPQVFAGKQGWTTPLRATNRVVAGPFKTDEEARAFVNALAKKGVSGFTFTSDKAQKITRLPAK